MDCREVRDRIQDLLDDRLPADDRGRVESHLEACAACAKERDELARTIALLGSLPRETAPVGFASDVLAAAASRPAPRGRRLSIPLTLLASTAAAAMILVAVLVFVPTGRPEPESETTAARRRDDEKSRTVGQDSEEAGEVDDRSRSSDPAADRLKIRDELQEARRDSSAMGHLEKDADGFAFRRAVRVVEVRVENPRAVEGRLRSLLSLSRSELEAEPAAKEGLARERAARRENGAPVAAGGRAGGAGGAGGGAGASTGAGERPGAPAAPPPAAEGAPDRKPAEPTYEVVLTRDQLRRLLADLDPDGRDGPATDEAKEGDVEERADAPTLSKKAKEAEADARAVLLALRALRNLDDPNSVRVRLLGRSPDEAAGRSDAGR